MELVGSNFDSSGLYRIYVDGDALVTLNGASEDTLEETARQLLVPAPEFVADHDDDWYNYGVDGHVCDIHMYGDHARIDGTTYKLT